jgi:hypothetical protein
MAVSVVFSLIFIPWYAGRLAGVGHRELLLEGFLKPLVLAFLCVYVPGLIAAGHSPALLTISRIIVPVLGAMGYGILTYRFLLTVDERTALGSVMDFFRKRVS